MAITVKLLTNECSAHYPRLWHLVESFADNKTARRYPIMLDMIAFIQEFASWTDAVASIIGLAVKQEAPHKSYVWNSYGADPIVAEQLEFIADYVGEYGLEKPDLADAIVNDLLIWHETILQRTTPTSLPRYLSTMRCPKCSNHSVLKHQQDYFCVSRECCYSWVKK